MPVIDRRATLGHLSTPELGDIARHFELEPSGEGARDDLLDLLCTSAVPLGEMLMTLPRNRLKELCRLRGIEASGREKVIIATRLLGVDLFAPPRPRAVPPIRRTRDKPAPVG